MTSFEWKFLTHGPDYLEKGHKGLALDVRKSPVISEIVCFSNHGDKNVESSTTELFNNIESLDDILLGDRPVTVFCHMEPDLDCFAASYIAWARSRSFWDDPDFGKYARALSKILARHDQGFINAADPKDPETYLNFYTLFLYLPIHLKKLNDKNSRRDYFPKMKSLYSIGLLEGCHFDWDNSGDCRMGAAMCLLHGLFLADPSHVATFLVENENHRSPSLKPLFEKVSSRLEDSSDDLCWLWEFMRELANGVHIWVLDAVGQLNSGGEIIKVKLADDPKHPVDCLFFENISADLAGIVAKMVDLKKYPVRAMAYKEEPGRVIISTNPERKQALKGLGLALHRQNIVRGCPRTPGQYRYLKRLSPDSHILPDPLFKHKDPWYDGRPKYTIVDAPEKDEFRYLAVDDVRKVLAADWHVLAKQYESDDYQRWFGGVEVSACDEAFKIKKKYPEDFLYPFVLLWPLGLKVYISILSEIESKFPNSGILEKQNKDLSRLCAQVSGKYLLEPDFYEHLQLMKQIRTAFEPIEKDYQVSSKLSPGIHEFWYQWEWIEDLVPRHEIILLQDPDELEYLKSEVYTAFRRFLHVRDTGSILKTKDSENYRTASIEEEEELFFQHRLAGLLKDITIEIESICCNLSRFSRDQLFNRIDSFKLVLKQADSLSEKLSPSAKSVVNPLLSNFKLFFDALRQVLYAFEENPSRSSAVALIFIAMDEQFSMEASLPDNSNQERLSSLKNKRLINSLPLAGLEIKDSNLLDQVGQIRNEHDLDFLKARKDDVSDLKLIFQKYNNWLLLGPRVLLDLSLMAAKNAVDQRNFSTSEKILNAFHPLRIKGEETISNPAKLGACAARFFAGWSPWWIPVLFYFNWICNWFLVKAGLEPVKSSEHYFQLFYEHYVFVLIPVFSLALIYFIVTYKPISKLSNTILVAHWVRLYLKIHWRLMLPGFLFKAGFGVFIAATIEFDYGLWQSVLIKDGLWKKAAFFLFILCYLGSFFQIDMPSLKSRLVAAAQTLGVYTALAHIPALVVALFLESVISPIAQNTTLSSLPGPRMIINGVPYLSWYNVLYMALMGMVVGILGDVLRQERKEN